MGRHVALRTGSSFGDPEFRRSECSFPGRPSMLPFELYLSCAGSAMLLLGLGLSRTGRHVALRIGSLLCGPVCCSFGRILNWAGRHVAVGVGSFLGWPACSSFGRIFGESLVGAWAYCSSGWIILGWVGMLFLRPGIPLAAVAVEVRVGSFLGGPPCCCSGWTFVGWPGT